MHIVKNQTAMNPKNPLFITGTDTEIGKTLITAALSIALQGAGETVFTMKPVAAGVNVNGINDDVRQLMAVNRVPVDTHVLAPYVFQAPIAPHLAAQIENIQIDPARLHAAFTTLKHCADRVLVEGAGGFLVPLGTHQHQPWDMADLAKAFGCDLILVVGLRLGCINHARLSAEAIERRGLKLAGWVGNQIDPDMAYRDENLETLKTYLPAPFLGLVPYLEDGEDAKTAAQALDLSALIGPAATRD